MVRERVKKPATVSKVDEICEVRGVKFKADFNNSRSGEIKWNEGTRNARHRESNTAASSRCQLHFQMLFLFDIQFTNLLFFAFIKGL